MIIYPYILPPLPYAYDALEPHIDARTMELHYTKHHQGYVDKLNAALKKHPELQKKALPDLLKDLKSIPEDIRAEVRNQGGGHVNHSFFWQCMSPDGGGKPKGMLANAIAETFGDFASFQKQMDAAAVKRFGSGWAWLVLDANKKLKIISTANQDSPLSDGLYPILGIDVWEHAYYLHYQNRRADYIAAWWDVIDWNFVEKTYETAMKS
jgi:Fe-Mn family superoxide dismutase